MIFCILGFVFISLIGSVLHFVYDWLKHNKYISLFVAVNESTWEHLKLAILPTFIWGIIGWFLDFNNYAFGVFITLLTISIVIPVIFYSYTSFTKKPILAVDISSFFIAIGLAMIFAYLIFTAKDFPGFFNWVGIIGNCLFALSFVLFTIFPPHMFLFIDPITKKYGRAGHYDDKNFGNNKKLPKSK